MVLTLPDDDRTPGAGRINVLRREGVQLPVQHVRLIVLMDVQSVLQQVLVGESMARDFDTVPANMTVAELSDRIGRRDPTVIRHQGVFVVDQDGQLAGIITRSDLMRALEHDPSGKMNVLNASSRHLVVAYPDEVLYDAAARMLWANVGRMPVVERSHPRTAVGYLGRSGVMSARLRRLEEEYVRDPGWVRRRDRAS